MRGLININDSLKKRLFISYGADWILVIIMVATFFAVDTISPFHRQFSIADKSIMFEFTEKETVPFWMLLVIAIAVPFITIGCIALFVRKSWLDLNSGLLGLGLALSMTIMFTDILKVTVGRPRPDMLQRCQPSPGIEDPPLGLLKYTICTADHDSYDFKDGFKSFPSGHSSLSFAGLGYLAFYLGGKMKLFDRGGHIYKSFVFCVPFIGALLVAISRLHDSRHHWQDVLVGGLMGTCFAYFAYRHYYPKLNSSFSQKPFAPRIKMANEIFLNDEHPNTVGGAVVGPSDPVYDECAHTNGSSSNSQLRSTR